ncbi:hypothetical protein FACS1894177_05670 [Bacteroidia bacterium]|nr:hypothetical protein FACS1894177_05670 [Bacteroidia bacterium]
MQNELNQYIVELNKIYKAGNATEHNYEDIRHKSISCMLSAIEIYNKPNFAYREESFAILAINAWELLLKAYIMRINLLAYVDAHIEAESVLRIHQ